MTQLARPPLVLLIALVSFGPVSIDIFLPSLPDMTRVFATDVSHVQLALSVFIGGFALAQLVYGPLSDRFGRRPVLLAGVTVYVAASLVCLTARSIEALILGRILQSFGACSGPVLSRAIVRDVYPRDQAARTLATMASVMALAPAVAPIVGGSLHAAFGWQANFVVMVGFGVALLIAGWALLDETNRRRDRHALRPSRMVGNYGILLSDGIFLGHTLTLSFVFAAMFCFVSGVSFVLIDVLGVPPRHFGFCFAAVIGGYLTGNVAAARFTHRIGMERMIVAGVAIGLAGGILMAALGLAHVQTVAAVITPMAAIFLGAGLVLPNSTAAAIAPHGQIAGSASALLGFIQMATASVAGWLVGRLHDGTTRPMTVIIAAMVIAAALAHGLLVRRRRRR
jgi:DHA1 family bicyclomycin/chloramphenicol resistance-like MFS transporter